MTAEVPAALLLGLLGSAHCVAMCGPLALALPVRAGGGARSLLVGRLGYNLGRALTYTALGAVVGAVGHGLRLAGLQRALSIAAGVVILLHVARRLLRPLEHRWPALARRLAVSRRAVAHVLPARLVQGWALRLQAAMAPRLRARDASLVVLGMLNGLLPCGLVAVALTGATSTAGVLAGARFMLLFGLGTLPLMLVATLFGGAASARYGQRLQRWAPAALVVLALLFLVRGDAMPFTHAATADHTAASCAMPGMR